MRVRFNGDFPGFALRRIAASIPAAFQLHGYARPDRDDLIAATHVMAPARALAAVRVAPVF